MSTSSTKFRYHLPKKAIKGDCPQCSPRYRRTLSRYIDNQTGELLPDEFGRCDRESNCGYHLSPYYKDASGLSYADQLFRQQSNHYNPANCQRLYKGSGTLAGLARGQSTGVIPDELYQQTLGNYNQNQLALLLRNQFGETTALSLLQRFRIGTSNHWPGACIFWYIDGQQRVRGGQIKLLGKDWHTIKYKDREGREYSKINWVHAVLKRRLENQQQPLPDWLLAYDEQADRSPCLFGLPQLLTEPIDKPVAVVEAPKTAIVATAFLPQFIWLAVGGKSYLKASRLTEIKHRPLTLFPDLNACYDSRDKKGRNQKGWLTIASELQAEGFNVRVSSLLEDNATDKQREGGWDIADYLLEPTLEPKIVRTLSDWAANPGSILRPEESQIERL